MPNGRLKTALIGCGKVGRIHATALAQRPESELVAVCDGVSDRAKSFAEEFGVTGFVDVAEMLEKAKPDAVCICTPHPLHAVPAVQALDAGLHVLVEKPMAATLADCDRMLAAAKASGATLSVVSQRRWFEPVTCPESKTAIASGKIGTPSGLALIGMFNWRDASYYQSDPWRGRWDTEGGGVLVNQAPHQLDLLSWFMGEIEEISGCWANVNHPSVEVEDTAVAVVRFKSGKVCRVRSSRKACHTKPGLFTHVHIHGSNGASVRCGKTDRGASFVAGVSSIVEPPLNDLWNIPGEETLLDAYRAGDRKRFSRVDATTHYHALQVGDFLKAILEGRLPAVTGEDGRTVVAMFTAIYRSQRDRSPVRFPVSA